VTVRLYRGSRKLLARTVAVDAAGAFRLRLPATRVGTLRVRASHRATPALGTAVARSRTVDALPRRVASGQRGEAVRLLQRHLAHRGYVVGRRGTFDARTGRAVLAFRKVTGMARTSVANRAVLGRLARGGGRFRVRFPKHGKHIEADLSRQVMALIRGNRVERIYPVSSGAPSTPTIRGHFKFYMSQPGYNSNEMYFSQYFKGGYAIHGYKSVPTYNASHGCLRTPIPDALSIYRWIKLGDRIDVYA
jgi:peptidoglycan hydrolase-like protein with peptidoglycan-binding domain